MKLVSSFWTLSLHLLLLTAASAATLYFDDFNTTPYDSASPRWSVYRDNGTDVDSGPFSTDPYYVFWLGSGGINNNGYIFVQHKTSGAGALARDYLLHTNSSIDLDIAPSSSPYQSFYARWDENRSSADDASRLFSILVDGVWYAASSDTAFVSSNHRSIDFYNTTWNVLNVTPGTGGSLTIDTSNELTYADIFDSDTTITSLGFYVDMPAAGDTTRTIRFDNVALSSGLLWAGASGTGGDGIWNDPDLQTWLSGPIGNPTEANWTNHETAIFGHAYDLDTPRTVTVNSNIIVRSLEFHENADEYLFLGNAALDGSGVPTRYIQINRATSYRSIYLHSDVNVTIGGDADTGLRIYRGGGNDLHLYGGGKLTIDLNGMVRTEGGGNMILNDGTTVEVNTGGQFNASRNLIIGNSLDTLDGSTGDAHLILNGGTSTTRTGNVGGDLLIGGPSGTANVTVKNNGILTVSSAATNGVLFHGNGNINLESGGILHARKIGKAAGATGVATLRFDGGKLVVNNIPAIDAGNFIDADVDHIYIADGGATIDTNGRDITILSPLKHDPNGSTTDGGFTKIGAGILTINTANTYSGATVIKEGTFRTNTLSALGLSSTHADNFILDGGTFYLTSDGVTTNREITITSNGGTLKGDRAWRVHGKLHAAVDTVLTIDGPVWLSADNRTTFHGDIDVIAGEFLVRRAASLGSTQGNVTVRNGATFSLDHNGTGGGNNVNTDNVYADDLLLEENATLRTRGKHVNGSNVSDAASFYSGDVQLDGPGDSTIDVSNHNSSIAEIPDLTINGLIHGDGGLNKIGGGRLIVTNQNTYTGKTTISAGTLALDADASLASPWIQVNSGAYFDVSTQSSTPELTEQVISGTGTIQGDITFGQDTFLKPGDTLGETDVSNAGNQIGTLTFDANLSLTENATAYFQIASSTDYDQLDILGTFSADDNTQLIVQWLDYQGVIGDSFDLLNWSSVQWGDVYQNDSTLLTRLLLPTFTDTNLYWDTDDFISNGIIRVAAVPEPSRALLLILTIACICGRRNRKLFL